MRRKQKRNDVIWVIYRGVKIPVIRTRRHKEWARQISHDIFVRRVESRDELSLPNTKEAESFTTYYINRLLAAGMVDIVDGKFVILEEVERTLEFNKMLWDLRKAGYSVSELAEKLQVPVYTVKAWLYYSKTTRSLEMFERVKALHQFESARSKSYSSRRWGKWSGISSL